MSIAFVFHDGVFGKADGNGFGVAFVGRKINSDWLWEIYHRHVLSLPGKAIRLLRTKDGVTLSK